jgi:hypothetical protein
MPSFIYGCLGFFKYSFAAYQPLTYISSTQVVQESLSEKWG